MKTQIVAPALLALLATVLASGCGGKDDRSDKPGGTGTGTDTTNDSGGNGDEASMLTADEEAAGQVVGDQIDEAVSRAAEDNDQDQSEGLGLADAAKSGKVTLFRACTEEGDTASVLITRSAEREKSFDGPQRSASMTFSAYLEKTRTWMKAEGKVACADNGRHAELAFLDMEGVELTATYKHDRARSQSFTNKKKNVTVERSFKFHAEGTRNVKWLAVTEAEGELSIEKEVSGAGSRQLEFKNKAGETKTLEQSLESAADAPFKVTVIRDAATGEATSRTIVSGTLVAVGKQGAKIETTFAGVKFVKGDGCRAVAGTIAGKIFETKDAAEPKVTFTVSYEADGTRTVVFSDGREFQDAGNGCDLDDVDATVSEVDAKADVERPADVPAEG